jgi:acyl carrier protein
MGSKNKNKIIEIISNILKVKDINEESKQEMHPEWDSLAYLNIVSEIEEVFKIEVSDKNINKFGNVAEIIELINKSENTNNL